MLAHQITALPEKNLPARPFSSDPNTAPITVLGLPFDNLTLADSLDRIETMIASGRPHYVATANVDFVVRAGRDLHFRRALLGADMILCDGTPLVWASRLLGAPLRERVAGSDLVPPLLKLAAEKNYRVFFLGTTPEINTRAVANVRKQFPGIVVEGYSPPFRPLPEMDHEDVARRVQSARPHILLVAFGSPKAEQWMEAQHERLGVPVIVGVGATVDFLAGHVKRAPLWMRRSGLEWIFRLLQEPRRLFRRYVTDLWHFGFAFSRAWWRSKSSSPSTSLSFSTTQPDTAQEKEPLS